MLRLRLRLRLKVKIEHTIIGHLERNKYLVFPIIYQF